MKEVYIYHGKSIEIRKQLILIDFSPFIMAQTYVSLLGGSDFTLWANSPTPAILNFYVLVQFLNL